MKTLQKCKRKILSVLHHPENLLIKNNITNVAFKFGTILRYIDLALRTRLWIDLIFNQCLTVTMYKLLKETLSSQYSY